MLLTTALAKDVKPIKMPKYKQTDGAGEPILLIAGNCRGLTSLSRLEGPANRSFEGFLLTLFPLRPVEREKGNRGLRSYESML
jgi:hypothetical protein